jgi:hypothetical protein
MYYVIGFAQDPLKGNKGRKNERKSKDKDINLHS